MLCTLLAVSKAVDKGGSCSGIAAAATGMVRAGLISFLDCSVVRINLYAYMSSKFVGLDHAATVCIDNLLCAPVPEEVPRNSHSCPPSIAAPPT